MARCDRWALGLLLAACTPEGEGSTGLSGVPTTGASATSEAMSTSEVTTTGATAEATTDVSGGTEGGVAMKCLVLGYSEGFTVEPPLGEAAGTATCSVTAEKPLTFDCSGAFSGALTLSLGGVNTPDLMVGETVELEHRVEPTPEFVGAWLRVTSGSAVRLVAGHGLGLGPADAPADWLPTGVEVAAAELGCPSVACSDQSGLSFTKQALSFGQGDMVVKLEAGFSGQIPGEFGGATYHAAAREARLGACGSMNAAQTSWYAFSIAREVGP